MSYNPINLGVNIDHIATIRQARGGTRYPDPVQAVMIAEEAGADGITLHLREDRRHIQDRDLRLIKELMLTPMNFEMAITAEMLNIAAEIRPEHVCFVPEKREELTTEGGLKVIGHETKIANAIAICQSVGAEVSIFIDADCQQIQAAFDLGAPTIEIHTGRYAEAHDKSSQLQELMRIEKAAYFAHDLGLKVNAGHGLSYQNVKPIANIEIIHELNIGHAIISRALFTGLKQAVIDMKNLMNEGRMAVQA
ncbi:MAG: pyridoxine 5'-phosphate synthase [Gammaproteobacteria bacterium]|nr:pyridoxine 5'-phosphate synthase [Gammaproteobacteria bacterium]